MVKHKKLPSSSRKEDSSKRNSAAGTEQIIDSVVSALNGIIRRSSDYDLKTDCCLLFKVSDVNSAMEYIRHDLSELLEKPKPANAPSTKPNKSQTYVSDSLHNSQPYSQEESVHFNSSLGKAPKNVVRAEDPDYYFNSLDSFDCFQR